MWKNNPEINKLCDVWRGMKKRCLNPSHKSYHNYGGRGIKIADEWMVFHNFREWALQNGYTVGLQIDRIDNDGDYCPDNCHWVSPKVNANNRSTNHRIVFNGVSHTLTEWAEILNIPNNILRNRVITLQWPIEKAFYQPIMRKKQHENY